MMFYTNTPFPLLSLRVQANNVLKCLLFVQYNLVCIRGIWKIKHISLVANEYPFLNLYLYNTVSLQIQTRRQKRKDLLAVLLFFFNET